MVRYGNMDHSIIDKNSLLGEAIVVIPDKLLAVQEEIVPSHINHPPVIQRLAFSCPSVKKALLKCGLGYKELLIVACVLTFSLNRGVTRSTVPVPTLINDHNCESMHTDVAQ